MWGNGDDNIRLLAEKVMPTIESQSFNAGRAIKNTTSSVPTNSSDTVNKLSFLVKEGQMQMSRHACGGGALYKQ